MQNSVCPELLVSQEIRFLLGLKLDWSSVGPLPLP